MPPKATKPTKETKQIEEPSGPSSNDLLTALMKQHSDDHYNEVVPQNKIISTGSLLLDQYVKIRTGGVCRLVARLPESGKTRESFVLASNYMQVMPKSRTLYVKAEGRLSPEIRTATGLTFVTSPDEWLDGTVFVLCSNVFETVASICKTLLKDMHEKGEHLCVIIDSLDGLILKDDLDTKGIKDGKVAGVPKLTKLLFRHLALPITHYDALMLITGQYSADISIDPYAPKSPRMGDAAGGSAIPHQCDYILSYQPRWNGDTILEDPESKPGTKGYRKVGNLVKIDIKKSATDTSGQRVEIPIKTGRVGNAIWCEKEAVDLAVQYDVYKKGGSWFTLNSEHPMAKEAQVEGIVLAQKVQGINGLYEYFENDQVVFEWFYAKFKALISA